MQADKEHESGADENTERCRGWCEAIAKHTGADQTPIREGDRFRSSCGTVWTVFDIIPVQGCWVHSADRRYQTMFKHRELKAMPRVPAESSAGTGE